MPKLKLVSSNIVCSCVGWGGVSVCVYAGGGGGWGGGGVRV